MDIEGGEFDVLNLLNDKIFPRQICLEFHTNKDISIRHTTFEYFSVMHPLVPWLPCNLSKRQRFNASQGCKIDV